MDTIYDCINIYLESKDTNQAIMITGTWGCGKSYFILHDLISNWKKDLSMPAIIPVYVSCFGINSISQMTARIKSEYISQMIKYRYENKSYFAKIILNKLDKIKKIFRYSYTFLKEGYKVFKGFPTSMAELYADFIQIKSTNSTYPVIILDDVERTEIDQIEILGLISEFADRQKLKVILVCNEEKVSDEYFVLKEKVIRQTITFFSDIKAILLSILGDIENYNLEYASFIWKIRNRLISMFEESCCQNIRTLQNAISVFLPYHELVHSFAEEEILQNDFLGVLLFMIFRDNLADPQKFVLHYKKQDSMKLNESIKSSSEGKSFFLISGGFSNDTKYLSYELSNWILNSQFSKEKLTSEVKHRSEEYRKRGSEYYRFINSYFDEFTSNEQIEKTISECIARMKHKELSFQELVLLYGVEKELLQRYKCNEWSKSIENAIVENLEGEMYYSDVLDERRYVYNGYDDSTPDIDKRIIKQLHNVEQYLKDRSGFERIRTFANNNLSSVVNYLIEKKIRMDGSLCKFFIEKIKDIDLKSVNILKIYVGSALEKQQYSDYTIFYSFAARLEEFAVEQKFLLLRQELLSLVEDLRKQINIGEKRYRMLKSD